MLTFGPQYYTTERQWQPSEVWSVVKDEVPAIINAGLKEWVGSYKSYHDQRVSLAPLASSLAMWFLPGCGLSLWPCDAICPELEDSHWRLARWDCQSWTFKIINFQSCEMNKPLFLHKILSLKDRYSDMKCTRSLDLLITQTGMVKRVLLVLSLVESRNSDKVLNSVPILHTPSSIPSLMSQLCSPLPVCVFVIVYADQKPREGNRFPLRASMPNLREDSGW